MSRKEVFREGPQPSRKSTSGGGDTGQATASRSRCFGSRGIDPLRSFYSVPSCRPNPFASILMEPVRRDAGRRLGGRDCLAGRCFPLPNGPYLGMTGYPTLRRFQLRAQKLLRALRQWCVNIDGRAVGHLSRRRPHLVVTENRGMVLFLPDREMGTKRCPSYGSERVYG